MYCLILHLQWQHQLHIVPRPSANVCIALSAATTCVYGLKAKTVTSRNIINQQQQQVAALMCIWSVQANLYPRILAAMKPGATLGLSHGFLLGVLKNDGVDFRKDINVVLVAPKVGFFIQLSCISLC